MDEGHVERRLAAILAADIAGYSRLMAEDEAATVATLKGHQAVVLPTVEAHGGRIQDTAGDGILAEFRSVVHAVECAVAIQRTMAGRNTDVPQHERERALPDTAETDEHDASGKLDVNLVIAAHDAPNRGAKRGVPTAAAMGGEPTNRGRQLPPATRRGRRQKSRLLPPANV